MRRAFFFSCALAVLGLVARTDLAEAWALYGCGHAGSGASTFYRMVPYVGTATAIGPIGFDRVGAMDAHPFTQVLYACGQRPGTGVPVLIRIDVGTGIGTEIGPTGISGAISDLAFRPSDGKLFAHEATPGNHRLHTIDLATGAATLVGATGVPGDGNALEFRASGELHLLTRTNLYVLNQATGLATNLGAVSFDPASTGSPRPSAADLLVDGQQYSVLVKDFDAGGNTWYGIFDPAPVSKEVHLFSDTGVPDLDGLAFVGRPTGYVTASGFFGGPVASDLLRIDLVTGATTYLGPTGFNQVGALVANPCLHTLYGVGTRASDGVPVLITIDPHTGHASEIGPTGISANVSDLAFNSCFDLYGYNALNDPDHSLYRFDLFTGAASLVGNTGLSSSGGNGIAIHRALTTLWHGNRSSINQLSLVNGQATFIAPATYLPPLVSTSARPASLDFGWNAALYSLVKEGSAFNRTSLASLDTRTGNYSFIGDPGIPQLDGLTARVNLELDARVTSPNGGENLPPLTNHVITWDTLNDPTVTSVDLYLWQGGRLMGSTSDPTNPSDLYRIDPQTGQSTLIGPTGFRRVSGMAMDPRTGMIYACAERTSDGTPVLILPEFSYEIGPTGISGSISDLAFRPSDNTLFAYDAFGAGHTLYTINPQTGKAKLVGPTGLSFNGGNGIAFTSGGVLYHANGSHLNTLDQNTGAATQVIPLTFQAPIAPGARPSSMEFHPGTGLLYAIVKDGTGTAYLAKIDISTGTVTSIGSTGQPEMDGMTFFMELVGGIASGEPNDGSYTWSVPNTPTKLARVSIGMHDGLYGGTDIGDGFFTIQDLTGVSEGELPAGVYLAFSPNPFLAEAAIRFGLPRPAAVQLTVHDVRGRLARVLVDGRRPAGEQAVTWDGRDQNGAGLPSGIYIVRLEVEGHATTRLATLLR